MGVVLNQWESAPCAGYRAFALLTVFLAGCGESARNASDDGSVGAGGTEAAGSAGSAVTDAATGGTGITGVGGTQVGGSGGTGESAPNERELILKFAAELTEAACEREVRCERMSSVERCVESRYGYGLASQIHRFSASPEYLDYFGNVDAAERLARDYELADADVLAVCIADLRDSDCTAFAPVPSSCNAMLTATNPLAEGETCWQDNPYLYDLPCEEGLGCVCGVCASVAPPAAEGGACEADLDCAHGLICSGAEGERVCSTPPGLGEPCSLRCGEGVCASGLPEPICVTASKVGEPCTDRYDCQRDLTCNEGTCVDSAGLSGDPCDDGYEGCLSFCVFETSATTSGTCGAPSRQEPVSCTLYANDFSYFCPLGYSVVQQQVEVDDSGHVTMCECVRQPGLGDPCEEPPPEPDPSYLRCAEGYCDGGICTPSRKLGESCTDDAQCGAFLYCDAARGVCQRYC